MHKQLAMVLPERSLALSRMYADSTLALMFGVSMGDSGPGYFPWAQLPFGLGFPALTHSHSLTRPGWVEQGEKIGLLVAWQPSSLANGYSPRAGTI